MNAKICLTLALAACTLESAMGFFFETTAAAAGTSTALTIGSGGAAISGTTALALGGGILLIKGLAIGALLLANSRRNRRSASALTLEDQDAAAFAVIAAVEPAHCYKRLICELASGQLPKGGNDVILNLFKKSDAPIESNKFEYNVAATLGKQLRSVNMCEIRYSCPLTGADMEKLFN